MEWEFSNLCLTSQAAKRNASGCRRTTYAATDPSPTVMMLKILISATLLAAASSCIIHADCPENSFCFLGECLSNQTFGGSCKIATQCVYKNGYCVDGFCACMTLSRFDGHECVRDVTSNSIFPVAGAVTAGLLLFALVTAIMLCLKRRRAQKAARAAQAPPLPVKYDVPMHQY